MSVSRNERSHRWSPAGWLAGAILCTPLLAAHGANLLLNPGFEIDPPGQPASFPAWQTFGPNNYGQTSAVTAHGGTNYFKVFQAFTGSVNFSGTYQDQLSGPGAVFQAGGWAMTSASDTLAGQNEAWIEVTFRDATGAILALYRSGLITTNALAAGAFPRGAWGWLAVTNQYDPSSYQVTNTATSLTAPPGTSFARFQITFQGDANNSLGSVYLDDLALTATQATPYGDWNIVWSDEFNGTSINPAVWGFDTGAGGWGNSELENYTSRATNAFVAGGLLHIVAREESYGGAAYTSARIKSQGLYARAYGRFAFRARMPAGVGFWPALWLLGEDIGSAGWPACGEIDVMESNGGALTNVQGSLHFGGDTTQVYTLPGDSVTNFHLYQLEWATNAINWFVDGVRYQTQTNWSGSAAPFPAPFNQPFFIIMNLAVGGNYLGNPSPAMINNGSSFPGDFQIDYVRVYDHTPALVLSAVRTNAECRLSWPAGIVCHLQTRTNGVAGGAWVDLPAGSDPVVVPASASAAFYRLASP